VAEQGGHIEHVVVDAASTDGTAQLIGLHSSSLGWHCSEPDRGISDAFNKGIRHATGDIIGILNADDWYEAHSFSTIRQIFEKTDAEVVHGQVRYWQDGTPLRIADGDHRALRRSGSVNHPSVFVRREVYQRLGAFDLSYRYAMDYELMLRWLVAGVRFRYLPMVLANMSLGGVSDRCRPEALREVRRAQRLHLDRATADAQYLWLLGRVRARQACDRLGLQRLISWQRSRNRGMRSVTPLP
jgi:GT2 family glycosyltransferase